MQPGFEEVTPCPAPLIPISSQAHHGSQALRISRIYEILTCFTTHWAPHLMAVRQSCWSPLGITTSDHHPMASPSFLCSATTALAPVATCNYLLADNCSAATSSLSSPFKTTLQHQGRFSSNTLKLGSTEQSQKGKHLNRGGLPSCDVTNSCFVDSSVTRKLPPPVLSASRNGVVGADCVFLLLKSCWMLYFRRI